MHHHILIVDDDPTILRTFSLGLEARGFQNITPCSDSTQVMHTLAAQPDVALVLLDLSMPDIGGLELLERIKDDHPELPIIIVTAEQDLQNAIQCMKLGADDYLTKPVTLERLVTTVRRTLEHRSVVHERDRLRDALFSDNTPSHPERFDAIVTRNPRMHKLFVYVEAIARSSSPLLILGETGTGKELFARAIHRSSERGGPFVGVNVAGLDDHVFADTLFGHKSGAYTDAKSRREGMIEKAGSGTLFLDEIGDLSEASQLKLLRLLQEGEYHPMGSDRTRHLRARVVAATHKPEALRRDLYFRLKTYQLKIPPLRERLDDLEPLIQHFIAEAAADLSIPPPELPNRLYVVLGNYHFPGNVRELRAMIFQCVAQSITGDLNVDALFDMLEAKPTSALPTPGVEFPFPLPSLQFLEQAALHEAMRRVGGDLESALTMLGLPQTPAAPLLGEDKVLKKEDWERLRKANIIKALELTDWRVSGEGGAAELLGMKPSTLTSQMKRLEIERP